MAYVNTMTGIRWVLKYPGVRNGKEVLDHMKNHPVDVILSDISMPVMDGIEVLKRLQQMEITVRSLFSAATMISIL